MRLVHNIAKSIARLAGTESAKGKQHLDVGVLQSQAAGSAAGKSDGLSWHTFRSPLGGHEIRLRLSPVCHSGIASPPQQSRI